MVCPRLFGELDHNILPDLIALRLYFSADNLKTAVFCLTSKISVNFHIDFLALGFLEVTDVPGGIVSFSVNQSELDTISASIIALYFY